MRPMRILICGCGYVGLALGQTLAAAGHAVAGTRRPGHDLEGLRRAGIEPLVADFTDPASLAALPGEWDGVVFAAAPDTGDPGAYQAVYHDGVRNLLAWLRSRPPRRFVFTGSTGVYGQTDGSEVDETSPTEPASATGRVLLATEALLAEAHAEGFPTVRLRVAGIYGPGRHRLEALRRGEVRLTGDGGHWMNHVHRDDLVRALTVVMERDQVGAIYNVSDGAPVREREFYGWLSERLGVPVPGRADAGDAVATRRRPFGNRRIRSRWIQDGTGWRPRYPTFREGYEAILAGLSA